jgi:hypothetical protein
MKPGLFFIPVKGQFNDFLSSVQQSVSVVPIVLSDIYRHQSFMFMSLSIANLSWIKGDFLDQLSDY